jgi:acetolactate synthase I/II/III large subunit
VPTMTPISQFASTVMTKDPYAEKRLQALPEIDNGAPALVYPEISRDVLDGKVDEKMFGFRAMTLSGVPREALFRSSWNRIRGGQAQNDGKERGDLGTVLEDVPFSKFAEVMDGFGVRVTRPEDTRPVLEKACDSGKLALVVIVIDREKYSSGTMNQPIYK